MYRGAITAGEGRYILASGTRSTERRKAGAAVNFREKTYTIGGVEQRRLGDFHPR